MGKDKSTPARSRAMDEVLVADEDGFTTVASKAERNKQQKENTPTETKGPEEKSRKGKARETTKKDIENGEPGRDRADDAMLPELPTEWPDFDLCPVLMTDAGKVESLGDVAKACFVGIVLYGYERLLKAHIHLVTSELQERVKEAFPDSGFQLSNWEADLFLSLGVTKKGGEMDADCVQVTEWSFAGLKTAGTKCTLTKARYFFDVSGLDPPYWNPEAFERQWRSL
ncbi:hypothetical protein FRC06_010385, partial [Ceratobasidium sp. 370]